MRDKRVRPSAALVTLGLERIFDLAALVVLFAINLLWFTPPAGREEDFAYVSLAGYGLLVGVILGFAGLIFYQYKSDSIIAFTMRITDQSSFRNDLKNTAEPVKTTCFGTKDIAWLARDRLGVFLDNDALVRDLSSDVVCLLAFDMPFNFSDSLLLWDLRSSVLSCRRRAELPVHSTRRRRQAFCSCGPISGTRMLLRYL